MRTTLSLLLLGSSPLLAGAQDFFHGGVSPETVARAGIYTPEADRVLDALALNPAGLAALETPAAEGVALGGLARGSFSDVANQDSPLRLRPGVVPLGAVGLPLRGSHWTLGLGMTPDFLSSVHWRYADAPGTAGADYGTQSEQSQILVFRAAAGASYVVSPRLWAGGTLGLVYNENTLVAPFVFQSNPQLKGLKTLLALHTRGFGWGGSFGLAARPGPRWLLQAAYSSPFTVNGTGHASGELGAQFAAAGIALAPDFTYNATVRVKLPQSVLAGARRQLTRSLALSAQGDWVNFRCAFDRLPVHLTNGNNAGINSLLGSSSIEDQVPLKWSDQYLLRIAGEYALGPHYRLAGGYTRRSSLVPNGTLTPLTGAIMKNALSAGADYQHGNARLSAAYSYNLNQSASVGTSGLLAGEFNQSRLTVGTQALVLGASMRFR